MKIILIIFILFIQGCATVGPVSVNQDDTFETIFLAIILGVAILYIKAYIEYIFAKKLERYKKKIHTNKLD